MISFKVPKKYNNKKISNVLFNLYPNLKSSVIFKAIRKKDIIVNGNRIKENITVYENDEITAYIQNEDIKLDIVYDDDNILIVNKPVNLPVTEDNNSNITLTKLVQSKYPNTMPCHRLDRNTSGLVVFAKNKTALNILLQKFKNREIDKFYVCIVYGIPKVKQQKLTAYLFKDNKKAISYISDIPKTGYTKIITSYNVIKTNKEKNISLLEVKLETGKTHQIRAHLSHIGHPIIGDGKYGINNINKQFKEKYQLLMSYKLIFNFSTDAGILNYMKNKEIKISYKNLENAIR